MPSRRPARPWTIVAALFVVTYGVATPLAAYGVFLPFLAETFGWSRGAIATALSLNLLVGGVAGFGIGALADRYGPRVPLAVTSIATGAAFALVATVGALWQLYLCVGVLGGLGMSAFYILSTATAARWFSARRGLAIALVLVGFNLGYMTTGPLAAALIATFGWRLAYALLAGGAGLVATAAALTVRLPRAGEVAPSRETPAVAFSHPSGASLAEALRDPRLWFLNVSWLLLGGLILMLSVHVVPYARDHGLGLAAASLALTAYGLGSVTGRVGAGALCDRLGTLATLRTGYVLQLAALLVLLWTSSTAGLIASLVGFGIGVSATDTMFVKVVPEIFGFRALGGVMGTLTLGWRTGAALGPATAGFLYDALGSYAVPFGVTPVVVLVSWGLFALGARAR